jgi:hypothetical protein
VSADACGCTCRMCTDASPDSDVADHCSRCWDIAVAMMGLGRRIVGFLRRVRIEELMGEIETASYVMIAPASTDAFYGATKRHAGALAELAAMAKGDR